MNLKRFTILIGSAILIFISVRIVLACADGPDPYDEYPSFFFNNINKEPAFMPFYFTSLLTYYDEGYGADDNLQGAPDKNLEAWATYANNKPLLNDIDSFVYKYPAKDLIAISNHIQKGALMMLPQEEEDNSFTQWLINKKDVAALDYLIYAKQCEPYTQPLDSYWDEKAEDWKTPVRDSVAMAKMITEGVAKYTAEKNNFLKGRYAYQAIRLAFYAGNNATTLQLYDQLIGNNKYDDLVMDRCLGMKAGVLYRNGKKAEAAYLYSLVFDRNDNIKEPIYTSFRWAVNGDINQVLPFCKNDHERAVLYVMNGLYEYTDDVHALPAMEAAYKYDPKVKGLDVIMTREINKAEDRYMTGTQLVQNTSDDQGMGTSFSIFSGPDKNEKLSKETAQYLSYLKQLNDFAQRIATDKKNDHPAFWHLASAYIYFMQNDMNNCKKYLDIAGNEKMNDVEHDVHDIINVLYVVHNSTRITVQTEAQLLPSLKWIEQRAEKQDRFKKVYNDFTTAVLAPAYLKQGDTIKAIYALGRVVNPYSPGTFTDGDIWSTDGTLLESMTPQQLQQVESFVTKKDKTPYEEWLTVNTQFNIHVLRELEGTKYIRRLQFDKAVGVLQQVPQSLLDKIQLPDFLVSHLQDSQDWNKSDSANMYNKLTFARKMAVLQQEVIKDTTNSRAAYQYANALYSMSYYGKAHNAYTYYRASTDDNGYFDSKDRHKMPRYQQEFYDVRIAEKYYMVAYRHSTDAEVKARCLYLAAKCWQKSVPEPKHTKGYYYFDPYSDTAYYVEAIKNPYFRGLKNEYGKTKFYNTAYNTCSYLRDYVKKGK